MVTISEVGRADDTSKPVSFCSFSGLHVSLFCLPLGEGNSARAPIYK